MYVMFNDNKLQLSHIVNSLCSIVRDCAALSITTSEKIYVLGYID